MTMLTVDYLIMSAANNRYNCTDESHDSMSDDIRHQPNNTQAFFLFVAKLRH